MVTEQVQWLPVWKSFRSRLHLQSAPCRQNHHLSPARLHKPGKTGSTEIHPRGRGTQTASRGWKTTLTIKEVSRRGNKTGRPCPAGTHSAHRIRWPEGWIGREKGEVRRVKERCFNLWASGFRICDFGIRLPVLSPPSSILRLPSSVL